MTDADFQPSKLGTKEHWDSVYAHELSNFEDDSDDEGQVWFGLATVEKMVDWTLQTLPPSSGPRILDIGCGNGTLSIALVEAGYDAHKIVGVDYSPDSVRLARSVAVHRQVPDIQFEASDFLSDDPPGAPAGSWDLLLDKGTYDAIALAPKPEDGSAPIDKYPARASRALKEGGYLLITSCNFTEDELKEKFITPETGFKYHSRIQHKSFTFGGKTGTDYATVAFQKPA